METTTHTTPFQPEFDPSVVAMTVVKPLPPFARLMAKQPSNDETSPKYLRPETHPFSLDWSTILEILSHLTAVDLMAVRWTCTLFMKYIDTPTVSRNIIAEAAFQVNVEMFELLSKGAWYKGNWFVSAYNHQYHVRANNKLHLSLYPADFFAINAPIEMLREMAGTDVPSDIDSPSTDSCPFSWSAVGFVVSSGRLDVVDMLMGVIPDERYMEASHITVMNLAISSGRVDIVEALFDHERFTLSPPGCVRYLPCGKPRADFVINRFQIAATIRENHLDMMSWMLKHRVRPDIDAKVVSIEMVKLILDVHPEASEDLMLNAISYDRVDIARWLLRKGFWCDQEFERACDEVFASDFYDTVCDLD